jgi:hypothetical protein
MGALVLFSSNCDQDAGGFASLQNDGDMIGFGILQVRQHEIVAPLLLRGLDDGGSPLLGTIGDPVVELVGDLGEGPTGHPFSIAIGVEESEYPFGLLEGLNQSVQKESIETSISELDATLMVLVESVHGDLLCSGIPRRLLP